MAVNLGPIGIYNVFVIQDMNMSNTDAEGRVAVGGNVTLQNYGIGASISPLPPFGTDASFVIGGNVNVTSGSNFSGNTIRRASSSVINYTMGNPNGTFVTGNPINFTEIATYLKCASTFWGNLTATGTASVSFGGLTLTGTEPDLNIFEINANDVAGSGLSLNQLNGINIVAPLSSTVLINVIGTNIAFGSYQIFRNGVTATRSDARLILWNFPQAATWTNSTTAIYGSVLAPFADATTVSSQINGNIIFNSLTGTSEIHNELFEGTLPDPQSCLTEIASISIEKEVSPDNGVTWFSADTAPGPDVPSNTNPRFRFTVTNNGTATLTNVIVTDDVYGLIGTIATLEKSASDQFIFDGTWVLGQNVNTATATGEYDGNTFSDTNSTYWVGVEAALPAITVKKEVSPDNGVTWFDANKLPGPNVVFPNNPQFRFTVTNTGNVTLTNVTVTDNVYLTVIGPTDLNPGESETVTINGTWALGQQSNIATATCDQGVTHENTAFWFGVEAAAPSIEVDKYVSPDNGVTWFEANAPVGPPVPQGTDPQFQFTVVNTGNITLTNVIVNDNVYGLVLGPIASLAPGESSSTIVVGTWALGNQMNIATATSDEGVSDADVAYWFGEEAPQPEINIIKEVSNDNGITWYDADTPPGLNVAIGTNPLFRVTVTNVGDVTLTNVQVTDDIYGFVGTMPVLPPGDSASWIIVGTWVLGQNVNAATVTGEYDGNTLSDTNSTYWFGVIPSITIEKYVSVDNGATWQEADTSPGPLLPDGVTPQFKFIVTNTGDVTLTNIEVTDSVFGVIGTLPSLDPGDSNEWII